MSKPINKLGYNLATSKLIKFLHISCQKWRQRALKRGYDNRRLKWRVRDLEASRRYWKGQAQKLSSQLVDMPQQNGTEVAALSIGGPMGQAIACHCFPLWQVMASIQWYLYTSMGFRCIARAWQVLSKYWPVKVPGFGVIRQWVLRLGYYKIERPLERAKDWVYIVDYTLQIGLEQCLVIAGARLSALRQAKSWALKACQVRILDISLCHWANGEHLCERLHKVVKQTGIPRQVVGDGAGSIRKGIRLLKQSLGRPLVYTYDMSHLVARIMKGLLSNHPQWKQLVNVLNLLQKSIVQTSFGFLAPTSLRKTARYMNLFATVDWTQKLLQYFDAGDFTLINADKSEEEQKRQFLKYFGPIIAMRPFLEALQQLMRLSRILLTDFKTRGLSGSRFQLWCQYQNKELLPLTQEFFRRWKQDMQSNIDALPDGQTYLASSDIIESIFGHYKQAGEKAWLKGMSANVLMIAAFAGPLTAQLVGDTLSSTSFQEVEAWWMAQREGPSFLAKRRRAFARPAKGTKVVGTNSS